MAGFRTSAMATAGKDARRVLLCGYYGEHNLGDDALLQVLVGQIPTSCRLLITAYDQRLVSELVPSSKTVQRRSLRSVLKAVASSDVLILGGGSLLQDSTSFRSLLYYLTLIVISRVCNTKVLLWGQGLGPLNRVVSRWLVQMVLPLTTAISWRDLVSYQQACRWQRSVPMVWGPDPVWCHPGRQWIGGGDVVVCWRPTERLDDEGWTVLITALSRLQSRTGVTIHWLAFHSDQDRLLPDQLQTLDAFTKQLKEASTFSTCQTIDQALDIFSKARLVIPMRLHALILAQLAGAPCSALSYDPKVKAAASMVMASCLDLGNQLTVDQCLLAWSEQFDHPADPSKILTIQSRSRVHADILLDELKCVD